MFGIFRILAESQIRMMTTDETLGKERTSVLL